MSNNLEQNNEVVVTQDPDDLSSNPTENTPFESVLNTYVSRRKVVAGTLAGSTAAFLAPAAHAGWGYGFGKHKRNRNQELVGFKPVAISDVTDTTQLTISDDYEYQVLIPWGTPIEPGATDAYEGDPNSRPTAKQAALQTGLGHDGMWFFPMDLRHGRRYGPHYPLRNDAGMLCINHEYGSNSHALGKSSPESLEDVRLSQNIHGVSVVKLKRNWRGKWRNVKSVHARRITVNTPVQFSGPAAASELLQNPAGNIPLGTVNNCGSGYTPWGTYLTCEENFNGYFGALGDFAPSEEQARYGFSPNGFGYGWHNFDKRFDLNDEDYVNESNRFGWIVEIDPFDGTKKPVKRTALGRFKHEAIAIKELDDGRVACYMGDDQRFDYCYKFVSSYAWQQMVNDGKSPLDEGTLYVARFNDDGSGDWLPLTLDNPVLSGRFSNMGELLINTRIASDLVGATPMDRPEWTTVGKNGEIFWTLTNNSRRTVADAANPEAPNSNGHIIRTYDDGDSAFTWDIYIIASDTIDGETAFSSPDAAWADEQGRLFIGTDGGQPQGLQDQLTVFDTTAELAEGEIPQPKRLLVGVNSDEITGFTVTPDRRTAFVNIQHPGNGDPLSTNFPAATDGVTIPRDCTLVITRKDGGIIGS